MSETSAERPASPGDQAGIAAGPVEREPGATHPPEPLPIWFFVGLVLLAYGLIVIVAGLVMPARPTALADLKPALRWGAILCAGGVAFLGVGLKGRSKAP